MEKRRLFLWRSTSTGTVRYSPRFKFQVVMEATTKSKKVVQVARAYDVHPNTVRNWINEFREKVAIEDKAKDKYGLNLACEAVELSKATWYYHKNQKVDYEEKYNYLKPIIEEIIREFS